MESSYSVETLAQRVNEWCEENYVSPANGQSGQAITERNIRYYRTLGLVDAPSTGGGRGYGEKHRLQLCAIRLLQAQGLPLNRIRDLLYGRTVEELKKVEQRGLAELRGAPRPVFRPASVSEQWNVTPLDDEFLLISRTGRGFSPGMLAELRAVLDSQPTTKRR